MIDDSEIRRQIAEILNIEENGEWNISSYDPKNELYCIHADKMDIEKYKDLRGVIISLRHKKVIAKSHGFSPLVISNRLETDEEGTLTLKDTKGIEYIIPKKNYSLKYCLEGTVIRVMRFSGTTYYMTHRQLDFTRSRWIVTRTFKELYEELNGPSEDELFDLNKDYSPYCYYFLIHHPEVLNVCRDDVFKGNLVYIGKSTYWNKEDLNLQEDEISDYEWANSGVNNIITAKTTGAIYDSQGSIPIETANNYLNYGFVKPFNTSEIDVRVRTGESVIVRQTDDEGNFIRLIKVQSEAYYWRAMIKGDNPNLLNQFFKLASNALKETYGFSMRKGERVDNSVNYLKFRKMFPKLDKWSIEDVAGFVNNKALRVWPKDNESKEDYIWTMKDRLYNIWAAFLMVVPVHRQREVATFYHKFLDETKKNADWIIGIETVGFENYYQKDKLHKAVMRIINTARTDAKNTVIKGNMPANFKGFGAMKSYQEILVKRIRKLVSNERGMTGYGMVLNRRLITSKTEVEKSIVQEEIDSFVYRESDFPCLPYKKIINPILEDGFRRRSESSEVSESGEFSDIETLGSETEERSDYSGSDSEEGNGRDSDEE